MEKYEKFLANKEVLAKKGLTTYVRLDRELWDLIKNNVTSTLMVDGHWVVWTLNQFINMDAWLEANPGAITQCRYDWDHLVKDTGPFLTDVIAISLSNTSADVLAEVAASKSALGLIDCGKFDSSMEDTKNPLVKFNPTKGIMWVERSTTAKVDTLSELDKKYIDLWKGHDAYYSFSDDVGVYKRGKENHNRLEEEGRKMGLTQLRMNHLFRVYIGPVQR